MYICKNENAMQIDNIVISYIQSQGEKMKTNFYAVFRQKKLHQMPENRLNKVPKWYSIKISWLFFLLFPGKKVKGKIIL